jgi:nitrogen fixation protein FixH
MTVNDITEALPMSRFSNRWAWFPVGLLGLLVSVQVVLFRLSSGDESFAIEPAYYQKAVNWDAHMRDQQASERLGWHSEAKLDLLRLGSIVRIHLSDNRGKPVSGARVSVDAFPNARATQVQHLTLHEDAPGVYEALVQVTHHGEWEVRLLAQHAADTYSTSLRVTPQVTAN